MLADFGVVLFEFELFCHRPLVFGRVISVARASGGNESDIITHSCKSPYARAARRPDRPASERIYQFRLRSQLFFPIFRVLQGSPRFARQENIKWLQKQNLATNERRKKLSAKYAALRAELKKTLINAEASDEERDAAMKKLQKLPRNSSSVRIRNRCELSGRPRGYYRKFGLSRIALRELGLRGEIPGLTKSSW